MSKEKFKKKASGAGGVVAMKDFIFNSISENKKKFFGNGEGCGLDKITFLHYQG